MSKQLAADAWITSPPPTESKVSKFVDMDSVTDCFSCKTVFVGLLVKHHCRQCFQVVCGNCSERLLSKRDSSTSYRRVCSTCRNGDDVKNQSILPYVPARNREKRRSRTNSATNANDDDSLDCSFESERDISMCSDRDEVNPRSPGLVEEDSKENLFNQSDRAQPAEVECKTPLTRPAQSIDTIPSPSSPYSGPGAYAGLNTPLSATPNSRSTTTPFTPHAIPNPYTGSVLTPLSEASENSRSSAQGRMAVPVAGSSPIEEQSLMKVSSPCGGSPVNVSSPMLTVPPLSAAKPIISDAAPPSALKSQQRPQPYPTTLYLIVVLAIIALAFAMLSGLSPTPVPPPIPTIHSTDPLPATINYYVLNEPATNTPTHTPTYTPTHTHTPTLIPTTRSPDDTASSSAGTVFVIMEGGDSMLPSIESQRDDAVGDVGPFRYRHGWILEEMQSLSAEERTVLAENA